MFPKSETINFGFLLFLLIIAVQAKPSKDKGDKTDNKSESKNDEFPKEDTDMLMEASDFGPITIIRSQEHQFHEPSSAQLRTLLNPEYISRSDISTTHQVSDTDSHTQAAHNYYPPFYRGVPPLGHSRPYFPISDILILPKYAAARPDGNLGTGLSPKQRSAGFDHSILGSGNFVVMRGGTFYPEEEMPYHPEDSIDFVQKYTYPEEQFAHFRDFADISTAVETAFSHFVVAYQAKNSTKSSNYPHPKNIFEQLELLDKEKAAEEKTLKKSKQSSKSKMKLAKTKLQQKKYKNKSLSATKEIEEEPLLALS